MSIARAAHAVASDSRQIIAIAGTDADGRPLDSWEQFDGVRWTQGGPLPAGALNAPAAAIVGRKLIVSGGFSLASNRPVSDTWELDLDAHTWRALTPMPAPRGGHAMVAVDGKLHVVGGGNAKSTLADHLVYDLAKDSWTLRAPLPRSKGSPALVVAGGQLIVIGGRSGSEDFGDVHRYDAARDTWVPLAPVKPRGTAGAVVHCGTVYLVGGESQSASSVLHQVDAIDTASLLDGKQWHPVVPLPTARAFARSVVFAGRIHVIGGAVAYGASHEAIGTHTVELLDQRC